jgi:hypothetical protein
LRLSIKRDQPRERKQSRCYRECVTQTANRAGDNTIRIQLRCQHGRESKTLQELGKPGWRSKKRKEHIECRRRRSRAVDGPWEIRLVLRIGQDGCGGVFRLLSSLNLSQHLTTMHSGGFKPSKIRSVLSVRRSRRPQARLETSCTRTGRPRRHLPPTQTAVRRAKAKPRCPRGRHREPHGGLYQ